MAEPVTIVDRGRGPQLSTSRITVQDLVPYLQQQYTYEQLQEIMPVLTIADIQAVERYIRDHYEEVMEQDRRIRERAAARRKSPEEEETARRHCLERLANARQSIRQHGEAAAMIAPCLTGEDGPIVADAVAPNASGQSCQSASQRRRERLHAGSSIESRMVGAGRWRQSPHRQP